MSVTYKYEYLNEVKKLISEAHDRQIEFAVEALVSEIYSKSNVLSYDDWIAWLNEEKGIKHVLEFNPHADF